MEHARTPPSLPVHSLVEAIDRSSSRVVRGRVKRVVGTVIEATLNSARLGDLCRLHSQSGEFSLLGEVVGFDGDTVIVTPIGDMVGISPTTMVSPTAEADGVGVGEELFGRILDGIGRPIDEAINGPLRTERRWPLNSKVPDPMTRRMIEDPLPLGVRVLDGVLTCGEGQRIGIFAAAGGGKSTLLSMLVNGSSADVTVLALIGERGREVREFIERQLGPEGMKKSVVVVATSDRPAMEQVKAAYTATAIAEYFRAQGCRVILMMDSVTRFARAQRAVGLAAGEPPTRRGFPPSVFAQLPLLLERTGQSDKGAITAFYTVLVEGDDMNEPVADETRSLLDGHIVLSRELAAGGHYPAIDVLASASRVMDAIVDREHAAAARKAREILAKYKQVEVLLKVGEYRPGADAATDFAVERIETLNSFLRQNTDEFSEFSETQRLLCRLVQ